MEPIRQGGRPGHPYGIQYPELRCAVPPQQSQVFVKEEPAPFQVRRMGAPARNIGNDEVSNLWQNRDLVLPDP